ncbi:MAG TPA: chorismate mutase [Sedimentibacter sp.]|nr:chorismate mutase [Sedimentibacter sp.]
MELKRFRKEIDKIDREIVKLLEKRFILVSDLGIYKKKQNLPVYDEAREKEVLESCRDMLENKEYSKYIDDIYLQIMEACRFIQGDLK